MIDGFVGVANELSGIETAEREDLAEAVQMLADLTVHLDEENADRRFDEIREF